MKRKGICLFNLYIDIDARKLWLFDLMEQKFSIKNKKINQLV
jgi:hypothetical protein